MLLLPILDDETVNALELIGVARYDRQFVRQRGGRNPQVSCADDGPRAAQALVPFGVNVGALSVE